MESGDTFSTLTDYMEYIEKYAEVVEKLNSTGEDLSRAELKYYYGSDGTHYNKTL